MSNANDFIIENGVLRKYVGPGGDVVIPNGVFSIGWCAFQACTSLTGISIPGSVTSIDSFAFDNCERLTDIVLPESVTSIGVGAFMGCESLTTITIPDTVASIGDSAFRNCKALADLHGFVIIRGILFGYFGNASDVIVPSSVTSIGFGAFRNCKDLTSITIPDSVTSIGSSAFEGCENLHGIAIPDSVTTIGNQAFRSCYNLQKIKLSVSSASFVAEQFKDPDNLRIDIPDLATLPARFRICAALCFAEDGGDATDPRFESHIKYIKANAAKLADRAMKCPALLNLMCREKLITAKYIDKYVDEAKKSQNPEMISIILDYQNNKLIAKQKEKVVRQKEKQEDTVFERAVARINQDGIAGLNFVVTGKLNTFENRNELKAFIENQGGKLMAAISAKTDYLIMNDANSDTEKKNKADNLQVEVITEEQFNHKAGRKFLISEDGILSRYIGLDPEVVIPENVKKIHAWAFDDCITVEKVIVPECATEIGVGTFSGCKNLKSILLQNPNVKIAVRAFEGCSKLADADGFIIVKNTLFNYIGSEKQITIPKTVSRIAGFSFTDCEKLEEVTIPDHVEFIEKGAFIRCKNLEKIVVPESSTVLHRNAFDSCDKLADQNSFVIINGVLYDYTGWETKIKIPDGVRQIHSGAVSDYQGLLGSRRIKSVTISDGVIKLWDKAFAFCEYLNNVYIPSSVTSIGQSVFAVNGKLTIHAPAGSYAETYAKENSIPFVAE